MQVNGDDLAGVVGGEVALTNYFSGVGEPYVLKLNFMKSSPGISKNCHSDMTQILALAKSKNK